MAWNPNLSYGASGDWFGNRDYTGNLKEIWDTMDAGRDRQKALMKRRQDILSWMGTDEGKSKIREHNQLGVDPRSDGTGGLGSRISSGDFTHWLMGTNMDPKEGGGSVSDESKNWFGHADLMHARASGKSWTDILGHLDENPGKLRLQNVKGGGGLYDEVKTQANFESQTGQWTDAMSSLQEEMGLQFTNIGDKFEGGMGGVSDAITAQTAAEERYRADQQNWQRRQENMQQMMIQEGRRKSREKPVMAVMPGQGSYGGGGGGAAAFARKKKQTTGLNIA
jgi:hypothetical protein